MAVDTIPVGIYCALYPSNTEKLLSFQSNTRVNKRHIDKYLEQVTSVATFLFANNRIVAT
ncbi:MAG: hypothetical protein IJS05_00170 [Paludibacteraceae bacterium]|nr:hypothetical protein [Paludibacteraceae bacterium]